MSPWGKWGCPHRAYESAELKFFFYELVDVLSMRGGARVVVMFVEL